MGKPARAVVIGTGVAGLAGAVRLAVKGYRVDAYEAAATPGGKLAELRLGGFRFDKGPSLFTLPHLVEELFTLAGRPMAPHFSYRPLEVAFRYWWEDGTRVTGWSDPERLAEELERVLEVPRATTRAYLHRASTLLDRTGRTFLEHSLHRWSTLWNGGVAQALLAARPQELFGSLHDVNTRALRHPKAVQLFDRYATYNGSDPHRSPGIMRMIPGLEHGRGAFHAVGGMHRIVRALHTLGTELGVRYHFNAPVERIRFSPDRRRVAGVRVNGTDVDADAVLCNMDVEPAYRRLMPDLPAPERTLRQERSSSALVFYWGVDRGSPELGLHNILFSRDYRAEFHHLFDTLDLGDDPTVYINITSKEDPEDAPPGCENWFVMINAPRHIGQDRDALVAHARRTVLDKVRRTLGVDLAPRIAVEAVLDPAGIEAATFSHQGSIYGTSSNTPWAAFLRHPNDHPTVRGLHFCGGSVHPGGGIPLSLLSARIATEALPLA